MLDGPARWGYLGVKETMNGLEMKIASPEAARKELLAYLKATRGTLPASGEQSSTNKEALELEGLKLRNEKLQAEIERIRTGDKESSLIVVHNALQVPGAVQTTQEDINGVKSNGGDILQKLHTAQSRVWTEGSQHQYNVVRCGRRWGKTAILGNIAISYATSLFKETGGERLQGGRVGIFTAEYRQQQEIFDYLEEALLPLIKSKSRSDGRIILKNKGRIDFWVTNNNPLAGRGREYDVVLIDEAAFTKSPEMLEEIWPKSIKPTLLTRRGRAWVFSTPNGNDDKNFFSMRSATTNRWAFTSTTRRRRVTHMSRQTSWRKNARRTIPEYFSRNFWLSLWIGLKTHCWISTSGWRTASR